MAGSKPVITPIALYIVRDIYFCFLPSRTPSLIVIFGNIRDCKMDNCNIGRRRQLIIVLLYHSSRHGPGCEEKELQLCMQTHTCVLKFEEDMLTIRMSEQAEILSLYCLFTTPDCC